MAEQSINGAASSNPFKPHIPCPAPNPKLVNLVPARYSTPTPRRETLVRDMAEKLSHRRELDASRSAALKALRVLGHVADRCSSPAGRSVESDSAAPIAPNAAALLELIRHEDERIIAVASSSSRSGSRSRSPPLLSARRRSPSTARRHPSPSLIAYHPQVSSGGAESAAAAPSSRLVVPDSPARQAFHANDGKRMVQSPRVLPLQLNNATVEASPLKPRYDPRYDPHTSATSRVESQLAPFFSQYVRGVTGRYVLPTTFAPPPVELNRRLQIVQNKRAEKERNERMKIEHPPRRKVWNYWERLEARKLPTQPPVVVQKENKAAVHVDAAAS